MKAVCGSALQGHTTAGKSFLHGQIPDFQQDILQVDPTVAECGGFLYLGRALQDAQGHPWPMAGLLPGEGFPTGKLVRFGYAVLTAQEESLLFRPGEQVPVHEFHHWDSSHNGGAFKAEKTGTGRSPSFLHSFISSIV